MSDFKEKPEPFRPGMPMLSAGDLNKVVEMCVSQFVGDDTIKVDQVGDKMVIGLVGRLPPETAVPYTEHRIFVVFEEFDDYLLCGPLNTGAVDPNLYLAFPMSFDDQLGSSLPDNQKIYVAKPYLLQRTPFDGKTIIIGAYSVTFTYIGTNSSTLYPPSMDHTPGIRTITVNGQNSTQRITPAYFVGDIIRARIPAFTNYPNPNAAANLGDMSNAQTDQIQWEDANTGARTWSNDPVGNTPKTVPVVTSVCPVNNTVQHISDLRDTPFALSATAATIPGTTYNVTLTESAYVTITASFDFSLEGSPINLLAEGWIIVNGTSAIRTARCAFKGTAAAETTKVMGSYETETVISLNAGTSTIYLIAASSDAHSGSSPSGTAYVEEASWVLHAETMIHTLVTPITIPGGSEGTTVSVCNPNCDGCGGGSGAGSGSGGSNPPIPTFLGTANTAGVAQTTLTKHNVSVAAGSLFLVQVAFFDTDNAPSGITIDGQSLTVNPDSQTSDSNGLLALSSSEWYLNVGSAITNADVVVTAGGSVASIMAIALTQVVNLVNNAPDKASKNGGIVSQPDSNLTGTTTVASEYVSGTFALAVPGGTWIWQGTTALPDGQDVSDTVGGSVYWLTGGHAALLTTQIVNAVLGGINTCAVWAGSVCTYS